jgi:S-adenosylmethionine:tRNA ribosyltransferase-isomerase
MQTDSFSYYLPQELIAQQPLKRRDSSRLMVVNRVDGSIEQSILSDITRYLVKGDVLVFNNSRVIPARFYGKKVGTGGKVEILLLRHSGNGIWESLVKSGSHIKNGDRIELIKDFGIDNVSMMTVEVTGLGPEGVKYLSFPYEEILFELGNVPLPPYIKVPLLEPERYQTVYADQAGSVAAPTAGLHFTEELLDKLKDIGVECLFVTLHIGLDTFRPVSEDDPRKHTIYKEYGIISEAVANRLSLAKQEGRRVCCIGTTTVRLLEYVINISGEVLKPFRGWVDLFILPGHYFRIVDCMLTNFHLPRSTLLMLVTAFTGQELIQRAYSKAIKNRYRFYSFGDAMLIL